MPDLFNDSGNWQNNATVAAGDYVPTAAVDGIDAVLAYNKKMLAQDAATTIDAKAVENVLNAKHGLGSGSLAPVATFFSDFGTKLSDFFSGIKWTVVLIVLALLFILYVVAKNSRVRSIA